MTSLEEYCRPSADLAVEKAIHAAKPDEYHNRYPTGRCPLCSFAQNVTARAKPEVRERVAGIIEQLDL